MVKPVKGSSKELRSMKKKFLFKIVICLLDLVGWSSKVTIISIKKGIRITFINIVIAVET